ncbi:Putative membrane protein [Sphingopyxis fribergensis]|uniref:Putative membrane protein n=2 Tax=Sphingopyxis fribergensis TaxID=1515612 RepID=A0A0A7PLV8_9SPHN|nr:Putative membrane protein [Sphingopyxis fribergensis]
MYSPTLSLTDPPAQSPIIDGVAWVQGAALGSAATIVAVIAVAMIGMLMLSGRLELRRGIAVVLGCFILFGAGGIAAAITGLARAGSPPQVLAAQETDRLSPRLGTSGPPPAAYDPYAGASVPSRR